MCHEAARKAVQAVFARTDRRLRDAPPEERLNILYECEAQLEALVEYHPEAASDWRRMEAFNDWLVATALESGITFNKNADGSYTVTRPGPVRGFGSLEHA